MNREKIAPSMDFEHLAASLGITESRREALTKHMEGKIESVLREKGKNIEDVKNGTANLDDFVFPSTSEKLVDFWNDDFFTPQEVLYAAYTLGYIECKGELAQMLGGMISVVDEAKKKSDDAFKFKSGNQTIL